MHGGAAGRPKLGIRARYRCGVAVQAEQPAPRPNAFQQRSRMASAAESAVDEGCTGPGLK
jgi:hypothetical protein